MQQKVFLEQHVKLASKDATLPSVAALEVGLSRKITYQRSHLGINRILSGFVSLYFTGPYALRSWSRLGVSLADNNCSSWLASNMALHLS